ncbi:MAG TPA: hypothetical protein PK777_03455, partial [Thermoguttaceae bacterium]|nr:hypothetical protein [Thermoguttaceae bacterium]
KPLFDPSTIKELPAKKKLPFECEKCSITFYVERKRFQDALKSHPGRHKFCSKTCQTQAQITVLSMSCTHCGEVTQRRPSQPNRFQKPPTRRFPSHRFAPLFKKKVSAFGWFSKTEEKLTKTPTLLW